VNILDDVIPSWHFSNHHERIVDAPPERVAEAIDTLRVDRDSSWFVRALFRARGIGIPRNATLRQAITTLGFSVLGERPGREIVFGIAGRFWSPRELHNMVRVADAEAFKAFAEPGQAKGAMNICIEPLGDRRTRLSTETRVWCADARARRLFGAYWTLIRVPSGLIRRDLLNAIARKARA